MDALPDRRALGLPDEPFSAYCKVCWQGVYCCWIEKEAHGGVCIFGHTKATDCRQAVEWERFKADIRKYREKWQAENPGR